MWIHMTEAVVMLHQICEGVKKVCVHVQNTSEKEPLQWSREHSVAEMQWLDENNSLKRRIVLCNENPASVPWVGSDLAYNLKHAE